MRIKIIVVVIFVLLIYPFGYWIILMINSNSPLENKLTKEEYVIQHKMIFFCDSLKSALKCNGVYLYYDFNYPIPIRNYDIWINYKERQSRLIRNQSFDSLKLQSFNIAYNLKKNVILKGNEVIITWRCFDCTVDKNSRFFKFPVDSLNQMR